MLTAYLIRTMRNVALLLSDPPSPERRVFVEMERLREEARREGRYPEIRDELDAWYEDQGEPVG